MPKTQKEMNSHLMISIFRNLQTAKQNLLPPVAKVKQQYIRRIVLKVENSMSQYRINEVLHNLQLAYCNQQRYRAVTMYYDIDPM